MACVTAPPAYFAASTASVQVRPLGPAVLGPEGKHSTCRYLWHHASILEKVVVGVLTPEKSAQAIGIFFKINQLSNTWPSHHCLLGLREEQVFHLGIYQHRLAQFQINNYSSLFLTHTHTHTHTHTLPIDCLRLNQDRKWSLEHTKSRREEKGKRD